MTTATILILSSSLFTIIKSSDAALSELLVVGSTRIMSVDGSANSHFSAVTFMKRSYLEEELLDLYLCFIFPQ
jgi:hypothetical protein